MRDQFKLNLGICPNFHDNNSCLENLTAVESVLNEAISSGIGVVCFSPDLSKFNNYTQTLKSFINLVRIAEGNLRQKVKGYVWASLTDSNHNDIIEILNEYKVIGIKVCVINENENNNSVGINSWDSLEKLLWLMSKKRINKPINLFQEDELEECYLQRLVKYAERYPDFRYMANQVTSAKGIEIISDAQKIGLNIMIGLTPYHLSFCDNSENGTDYTGYHTNQDGIFIREFLKLNSDNPLICIGSDSLPLQNTNTRLINTMQHIVRVILNFSETLNLSGAKISNITSNNIANFLGIPQIKENCLWEFDPHPDGIKYYKGDTPNIFAGLTMCYKLSKRGLM